jgi:hypothetical protein
MNSKQVKSVQTNSESRREDHKMAYQTYNLQSRFYCAPGHPTRCLHCGGELARTLMEPSVALRKILTDPQEIVHSEFNYLCECQSCGWWVFREFWFHLECNSTGDYITAELRGAQSDGESPHTPEADKPWLTALQDTNLYDSELPLPEEFTQILPPTPPLPSAANIKQAALREVANRETMSDNRYTSSRLAKPYDESPSLHARIPFAILTILFTCVLFDPAIQATWDSHVPLPLPLVQMFFAVPALIVILRGVWQLIIR